MNKDEFLKIIAECKDNCYLVISPSKDHYSIKFVNTKNINGPHPTIEINKGDLGPLMKSIYNVNWVAKSTVSVLGPDPQNVINDGSFDVIRLQKLFEQHKKAAPRFNIAFYYDTKTLHLQFDHSMFVIKAGKLLEEIKRELERRRRPTPIK